MDAFWHALVALMGDWHQGKLFIEHSVTIEHDALHILAGFLVWLAIAIVSRRSLASWMPLGWLFAIALWNEAVDLWVELWPDLGMQLGEGAKDLALTIVIPAVATWLIRAHPALFRKPGR